MTKTQIITATAVTAAVAVALTVKLNDYVNQIQERFPDINDKKIVRKAYLKMLTKSLTGGYGDLDILDDSQMDVLFRAEVFNLLAKKK